MIRAFVVVISVGLARLAHPASAACGDGTVDSNEQCDDGGETAACTPYCTLSSCGDGYANASAGEQCDGGPACDASCQLIVSTCGDGIIDPGEACDDGNHATGDGCSATCHVEVGWSCLDATGCITTCGDGIVAGQEACDDDNAQDGDGCSATCEVEAGWLCNGACTATCGDGIVVGGEECDDGNSQTGDGCTPECTVEGVWTSSGGTTTATCGDGIVAGSEQCDDGNRRDGDGCSANCTIEGIVGCAARPCETGSGTMMVSEGEPGLAYAGGCTTTGTDGSLVVVLGALIAARRRKRC